MRRTHGLPPTNTRQRLRGVRVRTDAEESQQINKQHSWIEQLWHLVSCVQWQTVKSMSRAWRNNCMGQNVSTKAFSALWQTLTGNQMNRDEEIYWERYTTNNGLLHNLKLLVNTTGWGCVTATKKPELTASSCHSEVQIWDPWVLAWKTHIKEAVD